jgi:CubicO group peptidase (beta-lactamase class C family)
LCTLDDPIGKFVPGVDPAITIERVLDHSSGLPAHSRFDETLPPEIPRGSWDAWRQIVGQAAQIRRDTAPGQCAVYSDIGFILLGAALEVMHGMPLSTAYALLGTPLFFRDKRGPPALPAFRPHSPIAPTEEGVEPGDVHDENARAMGGVAGHAGLFGTAAGVLKVAENLVLAYHGWKDGLLRPETARRLWQPSLVPSSTWALGWDRPALEGASTGGRWPRNSFGHLGFTGTSIWIEPDRAFIVALVTNRVCPTRANNMIRRLRPALHDAAWIDWGKNAVPVRKKRKLKKAETPAPVTDQ